MAITVPLKPVIAENIMLFPLPRSGMCVISSVVRISVIEIVNFTLMTRRGFGGISRCRMCFVSACLIQSFMVCHFLLFFVALD